VSDRVRMRSDTFCKPSDASTGEDESEKLSKRLSFKMKPLNPCKTHPSMLDRKDLFAELNNFTEGTRVA
jgi:hypothetical protein